MKEKNDLKLKLPDDEFWINKLARNLEKLFIHLYLPILSAQSVMKADELELILND